MVQATETRTAEAVRDDKASSTVPGDSAGSWTSPSRLQQPNVGRTERGREERAEAAEEEKQSGTEKEESAEVG